MASLNASSASDRSAAATLREFGAARVGLVAPYLAYMRQDQRFAPGQAVSAPLFARFLEASFDWLVTVDPHLHRIHDLADIFRSMSPVKSLGYVSGERPSRQFDTILHTAPIARGSSGGHAARRGPGSRRPAAAVATAACARTASAASTA